ncbi:hypothetical protein TSMEX_003982 [Taenia solium]|eukprot:TsM_001135400 transcript=TsM_001135400 gene=TsM_001135400
MSPKPTPLLQFGLFLVCIIFLQNITGFSIYPEDNAQSYSDRMKSLFHYSVHSQYRSPWPPLSELDETDKDSWNKRSRTHMPYRFG